MAVRESPRSPEAPPINDGAEPAVVGPFLAAAFHDERWRESSVSLLAGGYSNLTYVVRSTAGEVILRRPPLGHVLPTADDMAREYRVMTALGPTAVPVPRTLLLAEADSALGFQCLVMERVAGHICRTALPAGYADAPVDRHAIGLAVVDVMADLHLVEPDSVGLGDFGRPDGFMERQLRRWGTQWEASKSRELPLLDRLLADLASARPASAHRSLVHGDFRLDNTILHPARPGEIVAVLDWELSALGDPLSDLGALPRTGARRPTTTSSSRPVSCRRSPRRRASRPATNWSSATPTAPASSCPGSRGMSRSPT